MAIQPIQILIKAKDEFSSMLGSMQTKVAAVAVAIAGFFGVSLFSGAVKSASEFEAAMSRVKAAAGGTDEEFQALKQAAEDAGAATKFTGVQAAEALENLAKAGLTASQAIETLPAVLALAEAGDVALGTSAEYVTKAVMGMGLQFSDAARVADVLALGANATNTSVKGLAEALSYAAPTAQTLGLSLETTVAIIGKFADAGIDASRAGTALNSIMSQFADPASKFRGELGALGITTTDFTDALTQLAASGGRGSKAINAVGLEAGPALKALLNQGTVALGDLKSRLDDASGSAAATAKVMGDNLAGSMTGLGSVWDTIKTKLGTPVLPVLKDGVDQLIASLRELVNNGTITKFGESFAEAFRAAIKWARDFFDQIDFKQVVTDLQAFAAQAGETFKSIGENASIAGNAAKAAYGVMSAGTNTVMAAVYKVGEAFAGVASNIQSGVALLYDAFAKITFGNVSAQYKQMAGEIRLSAEATMAASEELGRRSAAAFVAVEAGAQTAREGFAGMAGAATGAKPAVDALTTAQQAAAKELEAGAAAAAAYGVAQQKKATADQVSKQATDDNRAAVAQLRQEYADLVASGSLQGAAEKLQEINKALLATGPAAQDAAKAAANAASAIESAFKGLGIVSNAELVTLATTAKTQYDVIKNAGTTTASDVSAAFKVAAEKAIAANNGIAPSWVLAQAGAAGYRTEVDAAGKTSVKSMTDAATSVDKVTASHGSAVGAVGRHTAAVGQLASSYSDAGAKALEAQGNFMAAALAQKNADTAANSITKRPDSPSQGVWTKSAIVEYLKQSGLDAKLSEELSKQFTNASGSVDYEATAAQKKWAGKYGTLSEALGKMAEYYKFDDSGKFEAEQRIAFLNKKTAAPPPPAPAPAPAPARPPTGAPEQARLPVSAPLQAPPPGTAAQSSARLGEGATYVSNINITGIGSASPRFADQASQRQTEELLRKLAQAKGASI